jgi:ribonuclease HI
MDFVILNMNIISQAGSYFTIEITDKNDKSLILFNPLLKELSFLDSSTLTKYLKNNEYILRKMLHNKRIDTYYLGFSLKFCIQKDKDVAAFNDRSKLVVLDRRNNSEKSYVIDKGEESIYKVYTDASYFEKKKSGAVAFIIEDLAGNYILHKEKIDEVGSSQAELLAAIRAVEELKSIEKIRIITDSQYVRKGLTEWTPCWKLNDWKTVNGESVKNIDIWLRFDSACQGKYIEFQWVKGHSDHFENTLCDLYAKETH